MAWNGSSQRKGWYTYEVHENCSVFKTPNPACLSASKILLRLDLVGLISDNELLSLQMITNQLKESIIQGWLLYIIRTFLQVSFRFQYQSINLVWLSFDFFSFSWSLTIISSSSWSYTLVCAVAQKYQEVSFIYNYSHF